MIQRPEPFHHLFRQILESLFQVARIPMPVGTLQPIIRLACMSPINVKCPNCGIYFPRESPAHACPRCGFVKSPIFAKPAPSSTAKKPLITNQQQPALKKTQQSRANKKYRKCLFCDTMFPVHLHSSVIKKHIIKSHPDKVRPKKPRPVTTNRVIDPPLIFLSSGNASKPIRKPYVPTIFDKPIQDEPNEEICPRCDGTGGIRQGCDLCNGRGWVSTATRQKYQGWTAGTATEHISRMSNADYLGLNPGAHFRDFDGRIGSNPTHDDYGEEGSA